MSAADAYSAIDSPGRIFGSPIAQDSASSCADRSRKLRHLRTFHPSAWPLQFAYQFTQFTMIFRKAQRCLPASIQTLTIQARMAQPLQFLSKVILKKKLVVNSAVLGFCPIRMICIRTHIHTDATLTRLAATSLSDRRLSENQHAAGPFGQRILKALVTMPPRVMPGVFVTGRRILTQTAI